jgi:hypothetical protein
VGVGVSSQKETSRYGPGDNHYKWLVTGGAGFFGVLDIRDSDKLRQLKGVDFVIHAAGCETL